MLAKHQKKLSHILPSYLIVTFLSLSIPLIMRYLLNDVLDIYLFNRDSWELWIPYIAPWFGILFILRPRLSILNFEKDNTKFLLQFMVSLGLGISGIFFQNLYSTASSDLVSLNEISDLQSAPQSNYYKLEEIELKGVEAGIHIDVRTMNKNHRLVFELFASVPFKSNSKDVPIWLGINYYENISNSLEDSDRERLYEQFVESSLKELQSYDLSKIVYLERLPKSDDLEMYEAAINQSLTSDINSEFIVLKPKFDSFSERNDGKLFWALISLGIGTLIFILSVFFTAIDTEKYKNRQISNKNTENPFSDLCMFIIPTKDHFLAPILISTNILVFLLMCFSGVDAIAPKAVELLHWGANRRINILNGEYWRLLTNIFIHGGIMHLFLNLYGLIIASLFIEPIFGKKKFFIIYAVSGLCGSLSSVWWYENTISVGASGAIFGLFGAIMALLTTNIFPEESKVSIFKMFGLYIVVSLLMGLTGGIDNAAHIGGLVSGFILGLILYSKSKIVA